MDLDVINQLPIIFLASGISGLEPILLVRLLKMHCIEQDALLLFSMVRNMVLQMFMEAMNVWNELGTSDPEMNI
jgi:hypothetical protein